MRKPVAALLALVLVLVPVLALALVGPVLLGHALFALGLPEAAARFLRDPAWRGYALASAGDYRQAAIAFGERKADAYNRGTALAHAGLYKQALDAYDAALDIDPEDDDARYNKALVAKILDQVMAPGDAEGNANAAASTLGRHRGSRDDADGDTNSTGVGFVGNKEGSSTSGSQGGSKVSKMGRGGAQGAQSEPAKASGSAGLAAGGGRRGGDLADVTAQVMANQRRFKPTFTARTITPTIEWLQTVADDPGRFLKLQIRAEQKRRLARAGLAGGDGD